MNRLALTRREGQSIIVGDPLEPIGEIHVVEIHGDKVKLAFTFPDGTPINRREVANSKRTERGMPPLPTRGLSVISSITTPRSQR